MSSQIHRDRKERWVPGAAAGAGAGAGESLFYGDRVQKGNLDADTQRKCHMVTEAETEAQADEGCQPPPEAGRGQEPSCRAREELPAASCILNF